MTDKIVVFVTVGKAEEAETLARSLVEKRLVACANMIQGVSSWYWWEGQVTQDQEVLLMLKTSRERFHELEREVQRLHSYAVPEVIALQIVEGAANYLNWIEESLKNQSDV